MRGEGHGAPLLGDGQLGEMFVEPRAVRALGAGRDASARSDAVRRGGRSRCPELYSVVFMSTSQRSS